MMAWHARGQLSCPYCAAAIVNEPLRLDQATFCPTCRGQFSFVDPRFRVRPVFADRALAIYILIVVVTLFAHPLIHAH